MTNDLRVEEKEDSYPAIINCCYLLGLKVVIVPPCIVVVVERNDNDENDAMAKHSFVLVNVFGLFIVSRRVPAEMNK